MRNSTDCIPSRYRKSVQLLPSMQQWVDDYAQGSTRGLLLSGPVGVGKTQQAWTIVERLLTCEGKHPRRTEYVWGRSDYVLDRYEF
jgi:DNA replication protein DnaC